MNMKTLFHVAIPAVFLLSSAPFACGQTFDAYFSAGQQLMTNAQLGSLSGDVTQDVAKLTDGFRFGFRMGFGWRDWFGHEIGYAYNRTHLKDVAGGSETDYGGMAAHQGFYDFLVYGTKEGHRIRPFVAAGGQFTNFVPPGASASYGQGENKFGLNYGVGVKARITSIFGIRLDYRQYWMGKPFGLPGSSGHLFLNEISAGFGIVM